MGAHIAFLAVPAAGHVNPTLPLVEELVRRGHRVTYATGPALREAVAAAGAAPLVPEAPWAKVAAARSRTTEEVAETLSGALDVTRAVLPRLTEVFREDPPDVVCYDSLTPFGPVLAHRLGRPSVATVPTFAGNDVFDPTTLLAPPDFDPGHPRLVEYATAQARFADAAGVPAETLASVGRLADLKLVFLPREFQIAGDTFGADYRFIGPSFGSRSPAREWPPPTGPVLFVSLGTVVNDRPDFFAACVTAFGGTGRPVVLALGERVDPARLGPIPANFEVRPHVPQPAVLRHAQVFLSHTGMNSTMEALLCEVPLVSYPQTPEQTCNGRRVEELGLGRVLTGPPDPEALRRTVDEVAADPAIRANLTRMAGHLRAAGGPRAGADAIEELVTP
ncbi:macrolide family glycosyltransferase [Amycolatopsis sp. NBC_00438]|uniref:macrolide family glycosyltransferase n=1 Tax=Amycolatopsis sp. NBC_00438 TaxID=2903558 RepID=UPI002E1D9729